MQRKTFQKAISLVLSLVMLLSVFSGITVIAEDIAVYTDINRLNIHPGIDETHLNFSWHSVVKAETPSVRVKIKDSSDEWTVFTGEAKDVKTSDDGYQVGYHDTFVKNCGHTCASVCGHEACTSSQCYHGTYIEPYYNRVTVSNLQFGKDYTYQLGDGTNWSKDYVTHITDEDPSEKGFSYLVFGDTQTADQYYGDYMKNALELATERFTDIDFMMNLGDNVHENNDRNYKAYYTSQDILAEYPIAVVNGNHELNLRESSITDHPTLTLSNPPAANDRQDYWFRYGDALFITFNSGPQQVSMMDDLDNLLKAATTAHPDARWVILQTHQGFYSNNGGGKDWRRNFVPVISKYDVDIVFNGHHHLYTRTESMLYSSSTPKCSHDSKTPDWNCAYCSGTIESLGANDKTVAETFIAKDGTETNYTKTVERVDPEGITYVHLDSLTAEGHDQYYTGSSSLAPTSAYTVNTVSGQGAITRVLVNDDSLTVETYWINNAGTPRVSNSAELSLLDDDYIDAEPYDSYTIRKTTEVKDYEVTFDGGSDRNISTRRVNSGETVTALTAPTYTGKSFEYWADENGDEFDFSTAITEDITLTATYGDIPATTTADLFVEAINRGDSEIILESDITLNDLGNITINSNTTIKSAEGQKYTLTLDGSSRLTVAASKTVTIDNINVNVAETADTLDADTAYYHGYITVRSGATLNVLNCTIKALAANMGCSTAALIKIYRVGSNAGYVYIKGSTLISPSGQNKGVALNGVKYESAKPTFRLVDTSVSGNWIFYQAYFILEGSTTVSGYNNGTIYDFRDASVKIARNKENLIELSKIGSGTAVSNDNYKIYYSTDDDAFEKGTAIEYTGAIDGIDYETPVYAAIRYTGTSYYSAAVSKVCPEYIEGVAVATQSDFVNAIANGDSLITLISDITLLDAGQITIGANTVIQSKPNDKYTIKLDGSSRLTVASSKTVTLQSLDIVIAEGADTINSDNAYYYGYITVRNTGKLYIYDSNVKCESANLGSSTTAMIKIYRENPQTGYVHIERSVVAAPAASGKGIALSSIRYDSGTKPTFRMVDSKVTGDWVFYQGYYILEGTSTYSGYSSANKVIDYRNATVKAERNADNNIILTKNGTGTAVTDESYKIYYSTDASAFASGNAIEYTAPIENIATDTPIYVGMGTSVTYSGVTNLFLSTPTELVVADYVPENPTVEGATILQSPDSEGNQDIRFSYSTGKADESNPIVEYGMLITLKKFEVGELTLENAAANQDKINVSKVENVSITESSSFVASIGCVPTNLYTYKYRTVVYVKYADGSVVYSEEIERSVAGVAKSIAGYVYQNRTNEALADLAETVEGLVAGVDGEGNVTLTEAGKANNGAAVLAFLEENNEKIANAIKIIGQ
ncbi:MAG: metallophosphoesterase [Clostridia bacterium]|nr:metallophosphoesterase [Clostridia bacterium]